VTAPIKRVTCPVCRRGGRRLTSTGKIWRHKPMTQKFAGHMVPDCKGSGQPFKPRMPIQQPPAVST
jgi:hypothetical protein